MVAVDAQRDQPGRSTWTLILRPRQRETKLACHLRCPGCHRRCPYLRRRLGFGRLLRVGDEGHVCPSSMPMVGAEQNPVVAKDCQVVALRTAADAAVAAAGSNTDGTM